MGSLSIVQTILSLLFEQIDAVVLDYSTSMVSNSATARQCGFAIALGFTSILLPFYRELERRINAPDVATDQNTLGRLFLLCNQARNMACLGARHLAKGIGYLPPLTHHTHTQWLYLTAWAEFCLDEAGASLAVSPEDIHALEVIAAEVNVVGYSVDLTPYAALVERLQGYISSHRTPVGQSSLLSDIFLPTDNDWLDRFSGEGGTMSGLNFDIFT
ncbi:hypothetical protein C8J57DRAFT_132202 [Mycena rebaudengoi]|nr:hypothetical protein C8J57DRAFT_132202 [Mycena rebaudengoi]